MTKHFLALNTQDLLGLAIGIEASNGWRYSEWADRFRPFSEEVSAFFDEMADDDDTHRDDLRKLHGEQFGSLMGLANSREIDTHTEDAKDVEEHFFVIDNAMAYSILTAALNTLFKARHFYQAILIRTKNAVLRKAYEPRNSSDAGHTRRLKKFLQQFQPLPQQCA